MPDAPITVAIVTVALGILGGFLAMVYTELSQETWRALRVRTTRRRQRNAIAKLITKRSNIYDAVDRLTEGLVLPGRVTADGRIVSDTDQS